MAVRMIDADHEPAGGALIVDLEERAAATLHLERPLEQSAWRIVGKTHYDPTRLVFHRGGAASD